MINNFRRIHKRFFLDNSRLSSAESKASNTYKIFIEIFNKSLGNPLYSEGIKKNNLIDIS